MNQDSSSSQRKLLIPIMAEELDAKFDDGEDVLEYFDVANAQVIESDAPLFNPERRTRPVPISTEEFDRKVEAGEDIDEHMDWENAVMVAPGEMPPGMKLSLEKEAEEACKTQNLVPPPSSDVPSP